MDSDSTQYWDGSPSSPKRESGKTADLSFDSQPAVTQGPVQDDTQPAGDSPEIQIGGAVGKYEIRRKLGQGGQAQAFLAYDPDLQREVVIKYYHAVRATADQEQVLNEGRALAQIRSPFVAQCFGADRHHGLPYLVIEYVPGATLAERLRGGPLDAPRAVALAAHLAEGLAAIHARGLLHLDLKPANILLDADDRPRIVDFGLAAVRGSERLRKISGTPAYMAPEQARGEAERIDERTDVFELGAVLYEMLGGRPPYQGDSSHSVWTQARTGDIRPLDAVRPDLPSAVVETCQRCLAKEPEGRWPTADALRSRLTELNRPRRRGWEFVLRLGKFRLQLSLGVALAGLLAMLAYVESPWGRPDTTGDVALVAPTSGAADSAVSEAPPAAPGALFHQDSNAPLSEGDALNAEQARVSAAMPGEAEVTERDVRSLRFGERAMLKRSGLGGAVKSAPADDLQLQIRPLPPARLVHLTPAELAAAAAGALPPEPQRKAVEELRRKPGTPEAADKTTEEVLVEAIELPAGESLRLELSAAVDCRFWMWVEQDGTPAAPEPRVVQWLPNGFESDGRLTDRPRRFPAPNAQGADSYRLPPLAEGAVRLVGLADRQERTLFAAPARAEFPEWRGVERVRSWFDTVLAAEAPASAEDAASRGATRFVLPIVTTRPAAP